MPQLRHSHGAVGARPEIAVAGAVAVGPDVRGTVREPRVELAGLLGSPHVRARELPGEAAVGPDVELGREDGVDPQALEESALAPELARTHRFYEGAGCIECGGTGFKGRTAICELLNLSDRIREMILDRRPTSEIKKTAHEEGMRFLRESAVEKVLTGLTTLREINKVTFVE